MLTTYLLYLALFCSGFLSAMLLRGRRADDVAGSVLLERAAARILAECSPATGDGQAEPKSTAISSAAIEDLRHALATSRELRAG